MEVETQAGCVNADMASAGSRISLFITLGFLILQGLLGLWSTSPIRKRDVGRTFAWPRRCASNGVPETFHWAMRSLEASPSMHRVLHLSPLGDLTILSDGGKKNSPSYGKQSKTNPKDYLSGTHPITIMRWKRLVNLFGPIPSTIGLCLEILEFWNPEETKRNLMTYPNSQLRTSRAKVGRGYRSILKKKYRSRGFLVTIAIPRNCA
jgi:hypothetical protein